MTPDNISDNAKEFLELYCKADSFAKKVSEFRRQVSIPAHNQLRYASHHFIEAMASDSSGVCVERLREARSHCKRAMYDAAEAGLTSIIERFVHFMEEYKDISIVDVIRDIEDINLLMDDMIETMIKNREKGIPVHEALEKHMRLFDQGVITWKRLKANRGELNKKRAKDLSDRRKFIVKTSLAGLGIIVSVITLLVGLGIF